MADLSQPPVESAPLCARQAPRVIIKGMIWRHPALPARSNNDRIIAGVCGGIGDRLGVDVTIVRVVFVALTLAWVGVPVYLLAWLLFPRWPWSIWPVCLRIVTVR